MHSAKLVHSTPDGDNLIAYTARVSNPNNQNNKETAPRLIRYLIDHKHHSPFEMVSMCVEISTTRSVAAQIIRHRSFSFQEWSQRYSQVTDAPVIPQLRRQDTKNRQNSINDLDPNVVEGFNKQIEDYFAQGVELYESLLEAGVAKESAREVLPLATPTKLYMHGTLRSFYHYVLLRSGNGTQKEHQQIALNIKEIIKQQYPLFYEAAF